MKRRSLIKLLGLSVPGVMLARQSVASGLLNPQSEDEIAGGPFSPGWDSLQRYEVPEWFRDAKFGIWAHWGPQCQPEHGDWYAREMYIEGSRDYKSHLAEYGHPSVKGFKDIIHQWKAADFNPDQLLSFYRENGAQYFMALANHHDNFDNFNSRYQPWNSVKLGPGKDLIGGWEKAARKHGLRFAVSVHASHTWSWYEPARGADKSGPLAGVPYDGTMTKEDGRGKWWEGLDPQALYAQNHKPGKKLVWDWDPNRGVVFPIKPIWKSSSGGPNSCWMIINLTWFISMTISCLCMRSTRKLA
ncbi:alpha-L-fucosidase [Prolixibacter bellariivorans]|uniref:alpha-L-fucosidase n=1 Tax=Prolixibacter bellariivorans TaxID=314319 RepID=UPI000B150429|nr:alpha-L-fucosidase [Prolixibacter bellariivorans]